MQVNAKRKGKKISKFDETFFQTWNLIWAIKAMNIYNLK